jgi:hypothetical protein
MQLCRMVEMSFNYLFNIVHCLTLLGALGSRAEWSSDGLNLDNGLHNRNFDTGLIPNIQYKYPNPFI